MLESPVRAGTRRTKLATMRLLGSGEPLTYEAPGLARVMRTAHGSEAPTARFAIARTGAKQSEGPGLRRARLPKFSQNSVASKESDAWREHNNRETNRDNNRR